MSLHSRAQTAAALISSNEMGIPQDAEKKAGGGGGKATRSSLAAPHLPAQKSKKEAAAKRKTFHDKWAEDESTKADGEGVVKVFCHPFVPFWSLPVLELKASTPAWSLRPRRLLTVS